jgi:hypothetical protein
LVRPLTPAPPSRSGCAGVFMRIELGMLDSIAALVMVGVKLIKASK